MFVVSSLFTRVADTSMSRSIALLGALMLASVALCAMGQNWDPSLPRQFSTEVSATTNLIDYALNGALPSFCILNHN